MESPARPADETTPAVGPASSADAGTDGGSERVSGGSEREAAVQALESSFAELMHAFRRHIAAAAERVHPGMLPNTFKVLSAIERTGPTTLSALADHLTADKGLLSRSVSELEELGLVARTADPADRRSRLIAVTPVGAERLSAARLPQQGRLFAVLEDWSVDHIRDLTGLLSALAEGSTPGR